MSDVETAPRTFLIPASDFEDLRWLLEQLTSDKVEVQNPFGGRALGKVEVDSINGKVRIVLRSELFHDGDSFYQSLIIDMISLTPERTCIGTKVVEWLKCYAKRKGFNRICIRNANTDASVGLARKLGFIIVPIVSYLQEVLKEVESSDFHLFIDRDK